MKSRILFVVLIMAILTTGLFASEVKGSDIVDQGTLQTVSGSLKYDGSEWTVTTIAKQLYNIHLGNYEAVYTQGLGLEEGNEASVTGFILNDDIAVTQITSNGSTFTLRDAQTGQPVWAGKGNRQNENMGEKGTEDHSMMDARGERPQAPSDSNQPGRGRFQTSSDSNQPSRGRI